MKSALLLGGNRYVGKRLARLLKSAGVRTTLVNRSGNGEGDVLLKADRADAEALKTALGNDRWDVVYDFSCFHPREAKDAAEIFAGRVRKYVVISSQSVYGSGADLMESAFDPFHGKKLELANRELPYPEAKRQMESAFFGYVQFPVLAVRFPILLGTDDYTGRLRFHVDRVRQEKEIYFPNLQARLSFAEAGEAANFLIFVSGTGGQGPLNFCSSNPISLAELLGLIEARTKKRWISALQPNEENRSPFGAEADWSMNVDACKALGFQPSQLESWLPDLIEQLAR